MERSPPKPMERGREISDIYLYLDERDRTVVFRGSKLPFKVSEADEETQQLVQTLYEVVIPRRDSNKFRLEHAGRIFRAQQVNTLNGLVYALRVLHKKSPDIEALGLPPGLVRILTADKFSSGLFLFVGETGQGKTTTLTATLVKRLELFNGMVLTVEDPIELFVDQDRIGRSLCVQVALDSDKEGSDAAFAAALYDSLRSFPACAGNHLVIGEIRTPEVANLAVQSAIAGNLVMATLHANGVIEALRRFTGLCRSGGQGDNAPDMVSSALRVVLWQSLPSTGMVTECLVSASQASPVASQIRAGKVEQLSTELDRQRTLIDRDKIEHLLAS